MKKKYFLNKKKQKKRVCYSSFNKQSIILLNGDYSFLGLIPIERAINLILKKKIAILVADKKTILHSEKKRFEYPSIVKLNRIIDNIYRGKIPFSKQNLFTRDRRTCQYCGSKDKLTIDHILPKSKGGKTNFENCVICCSKCNQKKGDLLLKDSGLYLKRKPYHPTISDFCKIRAKSLGIHKILDKLYESFLV